MAKITITIEDLGPDRVRVVMEPKAESLLRKVAGGTSDVNDVTMGEAYALRAIRAIDEAGKEVQQLQGVETNRTPMLITIPKLGMVR